jgi:hypothetical protein
MLDMMLSPKYALASAERIPDRSNDFKSTVLPDLYLKRGDAYAALKQTAKANIEYDRVSRAFPEWAALSCVE